MCYILKLSLSINETIFGACYDCSTVFMQYIRQIHGLSNTIKWNEYQRKMLSQEMLYVECYRAAIIRTVISFKVS